MQVELAFTSGDDVCVLPHVRFTGPIDMCYTTDQTQECPCWSMQRNERCFGYWLAGQNRHEYEF